MVIRLVVIVFIVLQGSALKFADSPRRPEYGPQPQDPRYRQLKTSAVVSLKTLAQCIAIFLSGIVVGKTFRR